MNRESEVMSYFTTEKVIDNSKQINLTILISYFFHDVEFLSQFLFVFTKQLRSGKVNNILFRQIDTTIENMILSL